MIYRKMKVKYHRYYFSEQCFCNQPVLVMRPLNEVRPHCPTKPQKAQKFSSLQTYLDRFCFKFPLYRQIRVNATMATNGESSAAGPSEGGRNNSGQDRKQRFGGSRFNSNNSRKKGRGGKPSK